MSRLSQRPQHSILKIVGFKKWIVQEWGKPAHCADIVQAVAAVCIYAVKTPSRPTRKGVVSA